MSGDRPEVLTAALDPDGEAYIHAELEDLRNKLTAAPARSSNRKGQLAAVALVCVSVVAAVALYVGTDNAVVLTGYFTAVGGIVSSFAQGNTSEHAMKARTPTPQYPPQQPPQGWAQR